MPRSGILSAAIQRSLAVRKGSDTVLQYTVRIANDKLTAVSR